ncbi:phosphate ABC transporter substrate-binding protein [Spiroplasma endosymbiont of Diplazon laetatorius]|uniref:phosphate ABC transporter substrate-binding protein n=1 Tax=Spiroplasma endosymbiont of Diplazon laetatorius TaxID=3066322 RepID=UPI0030D15A1E
MSKKISIILLVFLSTILGLWIWSIAVPKNSIILGGSTSVNPFMQKLTKKYYDTDEGKDFIYNSTGSQAGVGGVEKDMYSAGFISKDINSGTLTKGNTFLDMCNDKQTEPNNGIKKCAYTSGEIPHSENLRKDSYVALEFAIDAIGIIYNAPAYWDEPVKYGVNDEKSITLNDIANFNIKTSDKNKVDGKKLLAEIYSGKKQWKEIATVLISPYNNGEGEFDQQIYNGFTQLINKQPGIKLVTFTREDGSGTRSAFSDLTGVKDMSSSNVVNSNGSMIENMQRAPSLGYVSNAFLTQLNDDGPIKLAGIDEYKLPIGKGNKPQEWKDETHEWEKMEIETEDFIKTDYTFKRPFIAIFNTHTKKIEELMKLFDFMNSDKSNEVFESEGLVKDMNYQSLDGGAYA